MTLREALRERRVLREQRDDALIALQSCALAFSEIAKALDAVARTTGVEEAARLATHTRNLERQTNNFIAVSQEHA